MKKLAIVTTHPIQYNAPLFKLLNERGKILIKVFYTWGEEVLKDKFDPGFGKNIKWDIPLLEGYDFRFVKNIAKEPGSHHFSGIQNPGLISDIKVFNPEAILIFGWSFKSHLKVMRYFSGKKKIFFRGDSTLLNDQKEFSIKKLVRKIFLKWVYKHVDVAFYVGQNNKKYFLQFGLKESQLIFAPHAIDNERFSATDIDFFREQLRIKKDQIVFLYAGKFEPVKNPGLLLDAFIKSELKNVHLVLVGNGPLESELKEAAKTFNTIHFVPFQNQSQMPKVYQSADIYVLPSQSETWGLAINEAMAAGLAILVSNKCGCAIDLVENEVNGFIFESGNVDQLAAKIKILALDKKRVSEMGDQSAINIQNWSFNHICDSIERSMDKIDKF